MAPEPPPPGDAVEDARWPPARWRRLYSIVLGALVVEIALLWALSRAFS
jgi:hypothetical protein